MARIAAIIAALVLTAAPAAGAAASPDQLLESGVLTPNTAPDRPVVTKTSLDYAATYRLVLTGEWTTHWPAGNVGGESWAPYDEVDDAIYCVSQEPVPIGEECSNGYVHAWSGIGVEVGDHPYETSLSTLTDSELPPQSGDHTYDITFVAPHAGVLKLWDLFAGHYGQSGYPTRADGSFDFRLYGAKAGGGSGSGSGGGAVPKAWRVGPVNFYIPRGGASFKGNTYRFVVRSRRRAVVRETVTAYLRNRGYKAGVTNGLLAAGKAYYLSVKIPAPTVRVLEAGLAAGDPLTMRSIVTVTSAEGTLKRTIDVPFTSS